MSLNTAMKLANQAAQAARLQRLQTSGTTQPADAPVDLLPQDYVGAGVAAAQGSLAMLKAAMQPMVEAGNALNLDRLTLSIEALNAEWTQHGAVTAATATALQCELAGLVGLEQMAQAQDLIRGNDEEVIRAETALRYADGMGPSVRAIGTALYGLSHSLELMTLQNGLTTDPIWLAETARNAAPMAQLSTFSNHVMRARFPMWFDETSDLHVGSQWIAGGIARASNDDVLAAIASGSAQCDPLVLDLNGGGIDTTGIGSNGTRAMVLFDHDGDGIKTATGWAAVGEGILVRDLDGNGAIDNGSELFGENTLLAHGARAGQRAFDGFDALRNLDSNADARFNAADAAYASVKIWTDLNQDGHSQSEELFTLDQLGIVDIGLNATAVLNQDTNRNTQTASGTFTQLVDRADPNAGAVQREVGNFLLDENAFYREYVTQPSASASVQSLPNMLGSGKVHNLQIAMSLDTPAATALRASVTAFAALPTAQAQLNAIEALIQDWASTSTMPNSVQALQASGDAELSAMFKEFAQTNPVQYRMILALEPFHGTDILRALVEQNSASDLNSQEIDSRPLMQLETAYMKLVASVYGELVAQTRLKPYLDSMNPVLDAEGLHINQSALSNMLLARPASDYKNTLNDFYELIRYAGNPLQKAGIDIPQLVTDLRPILPAGFDSKQLFDQLYVGPRMGRTIGMQIVTGTSADDYVHSNSSNIYIFAGDGDDRLVSAWGTNHFDGGAGNDAFDCYRGKNTFYFGNGDGNDRVKADWFHNYAGGNTLQLKAGIAASDVEMSRDGEDLTVVLKGGKDRVTFNQYFGPNRNYSEYGGVEGERVTLSIQFADGTRWNDADIASHFHTAQGVQPTIYGDALANTLRGQQASNDNLLGMAGNDTYLFGRGDGHDTILDYDAESGNNDTLRFVDNIAQNNLWLTQSGNDLQVGVLGTGDQVTIAGWFAPDGWDAYYQMEHIETSDGQSLDVAQVNRLVQAMAAYGAPAAGQLEWPAANDAGNALFAAVNGLNGQSGASNATFGDRNTALSA